MTVRIFYIAVIHNKEIDIKHSTQMMKNQKLQEIISNIFPSIFSRNEEWKLSDCQ